MYHFIGCFEQILCSTSKQKCNQRKFRHPYLSISVNVLAYLLMNHFLFSKQIYPLIPSKTYRKFKLCWICYVFLSSIDFYSVRKKFCKFILKRRIISLMHSSILRRIWLNFMAQYLLGFFSAHLL
jgi:hypothetical protein